MAGWGANGIGFEGGWGLVSVYVSTFDGEFEYGVADGNTDGRGVRYWIVDRWEVAASDTEDDGDDIVDDWGAFGGARGGWGGDEGVARAGVGEWGAAEVGFDSHGFGFGGGRGDFLIGGSGLVMVLVGFFGDARPVGHVVWMGAGLGLLGSPCADGDGEFDLSGA